MESQPHDKQQRTMPCPPEKSAFQAAQVPTGQNRGSERRSIRRLVLATCLFLVLLVVTTTSGPVRLWRGLHCHGRGAAEVVTGPEAEATAFSTLLHKYFPGRYQHSVWPAGETSVARVARRQDNSTSSSSSSSSSSSTPSSSSSSTSKSSSSSSSSSSPPARNDGSSSSSSSSSSANNPGTTPDPTPTPSPTPSPTPGPSATANDNPTPPPGTSSPTPDNRAPNPTGTTGAAVSSDQGAKTTQAPADNSDPSNVVDGGTTLTRLTTLPGGSVVPEAPRVTRSSKEIVTTLTSTLPNGSVVVVTQTSVVPADPVVTGDVGGANAPSLHNDASRQGGVVMLMGLVGVAAGAVLA
ncbi:hypothetical protein QBC47DRAFT_16445 [Echria macrotheca]|uniref:Uncharacterized protein n=1 Tax=Echria macrotheca TaxID=438768 RepID=A0AAJ0BPQ5_9PEZI|nr:hypothetical protein QBC47DRAFT_16445 [Echria macrotheca]